MEARRQVPKELRKGFDSAELLVSWRLWREPNSRVFDGVATNAVLAGRRVLDEGDEWTKEMSGRFLWSTSFW